MAIEELAEEGEEIDLDPPCVAVFKKAQDMAWQLKQMCKAELQVMLERASGRKHRCHSCNQMKIAKASAESLQKLFCVNIQL